MLAARCLSVAIRIHAPVFCYSAKSASLSPYIEGAAAATEERAAVSGARYAAMLREKSCYKSNQTIVL